MRISELSTRSGVAIPSIKFYLREGLIEAGERSSPNQASYDDRHVERLRLVRALIDVGGLSVASVRAVLAAVDDDSMPLDWAFGRAQRAIPGALPPEGEPLAESRGTAEIETLLAVDDWQISKGNPRSGSNRCSRRPRRRWSGSRSCVDGRDRRRRNRARRFAFRRTPPHCSRERISLSRTSSTTYFR